MCTKNRMIMRDAFEMRWDLHNFCMTNLLLSLHWTTFVGLNGTKLNQVSGKTDDCITRPMRRSTVINWTAIWHRPVAGNHCYKSSKLRCSVGLSRRWHRTLLVCEGVLPRCLSSWLHLVHTLDHFVGFFGVETEYLLVSESADGNITGWALLSTVLSWVAW